MGLRLHATLYGTTIKRVSCSKHPGTDIFLKNIHSLLQKTHSVSFDYGNMGRQRGLTKSPTSEERISKVHAGFRAVSFIEIDFRVL